MNQNQVEIYQEPPDADNWTQRLKKNPGEPDYDYIRHLYESWLTELEGLAVTAIASGDWSDVLNHIAAFENGPSL